MLYACYDLIPLHKVMELSWRHNLSDFTMPFMINYMSQQASKIDTLRRDNEERKAREKSTEVKEESTPMIGNPLMITAGAGMMGSQSNGYGGGMMNGGMMPQSTGYGGY